jgi:hypothetical protein
MVLAMKNTTELISLKEEQGLGTSSEDQATFYYRLRRHIS